MASPPSFAPFPGASWRSQLSPQDWDSLTKAWIALAQLYISLDDDSFSKAVGRDESVAVFISTFVEEASAGSLTHVPSSGRLLNAVFRLTSRLLTAPRPDPSLLSFEFLAGLAKVFPRKLTTPILVHLFAEQTAAVEASLLALKKLLIPQLELGIKGDLKLVETQLVRLNHLLHASPDACVVFLAGSDFVDGLVTCFRVMNPPLRQAITTTLYLCLARLAERESPRWSMISDQLFNLQTTAESHRKGPLNANDSLVADLVTNTPLLRFLLRRAEESGAAASLRTRITALETYKTGVIVRPRRRPLRRKLDKGKGKETDDDVDDGHAVMHVHRMSQITQVQDLFPDLGAGFVSKCLDEYGDDVELVVANLLGESLPSHLATADRSEPLYAKTSSTQQKPEFHTDMAPHPTPPQVPARRKNVFDDDDFDRLAMDVSKVSFGKDLDKTADDVLRDKSGAPGKAAILSALAAFDSDDDERDDTYDAADVGGTVDAAHQEADGAAERNEEALFRAYQADPKVFGREAETRRSAARGRLREETGMADEAIEGWALMLARNPGQMRRLEGRFAFKGQQAQLERTAWRAAAGGSGAEDSEQDGGGPSSRGGSTSRGRGRGGYGRGAGGGQGGRGRGRGGAVAGPAGEKETESARRHKEANKGSRANHNRRDARAKKMSRGFA